MKFKQLAILVAIITLTVSVAVAARNKTTIQIYEPTMVGSATLPPGEYTVEWIGVGPDVQVNFLQDNETIATVPATLQAVQNPYDSVTTDAQAAGLRVLLEIDTKTLALHFSRGDFGGGK